MATTDQIDNLAQLYPDDQSAGSPFDTGDLNAIAPPYKRLVALIGDCSFESQRRQVHSKAPGAKWTYQIINSLPLSLNVPILGTFHASDVKFYDFGTLPVPNTSNVMDTMISFVSTSDPNNHGRSDLLTWPEYDPTDKRMYQFVYSGPDIISDTYRVGPMNYIIDNADSLLK